MNDLDEAIAIRPDGTTYVSGVLPQGQAFVKKNVQGNAQDRAGLERIRIQSLRQLDWATLLPAFPSGTWTASDPKLAVVTGGVSAAGVIRCAASCTAGFTNGFFVSGLVEQAGTVSSRFTKTYGTPGANPVDYDQWFEAYHPLALAGSGSDTYLAREFSPYGVYWDPTVLILSRLDSTGTETASRDLSSAAAPQPQGPLSLIVNGSGEPILAGRDVITGGWAIYWQRFSPDLPFSYRQLLCAHW